MNQKTKFKKTKSMAANVKRKVNSRRRNLFGLVACENGDQLNKMPG